ncbi:hypothetical protein KBY91_31845 [Streptomyces sp. RK23]|uniref:hypothetical protein n=1 Tax=unclassified Streptomyces TaxID=2593676 RepID=UPI001B368160|nr:MULTISPECIES: hypothetical protein [unclassified Streptomyces]MBQ0967462.1 hypothetical protein [Streptomyces sp. RK74B]MBQ1008007.1 hypothetical protein [Streptomyces sp. RK23]
MTQNRRHKLWIRAFQAATGTTYMAAHRRQLSWPTLAEVMEEHRTLTDFGIGVFDSDRLTVGWRRAELAAARERLRREEDLVLDRAQWLRDNVMPIKTHSADSYGVKHLIEDATGVYMPNGVFIAAALIVGYPFRYDEPNVRFGMSQRDLNKLR